MVEKLIGSSTIYEFKWPSDHIFHVVTTMSYRSRIYGVIV